MGRRKGQIAKMGNSQLVKDKVKRHGHRQTGSESFLHTTDLNDGTNYNRINFQSVTEQSNLEDFLNTAEMAGTDFTAERQNIQIISNLGQGVRLSASDKQKISEAQHTHKALLQIPRRPYWDEMTTKEALALMERESFTDWRRQLKILQEKQHIELTPYEKNLDFWRQLWRVIERSDVVVQIVDARNPLLFRCEDLETYTKEVDPNKTVMLLINKADYLNLEQRKQWVDYFNKEGITAVFFSAKIEKEKQEGMKETVMETESSMENDLNLSGNDEMDFDDNDDDDESDRLSVEDTEKSSSQSTETEKEALKSDLTPDLKPADTETDTMLGEKGDDCFNNVGLSESQSSTVESSSSQSEKSSEEMPTSEALPIKNTTRIVSAEELLDIFRALAHPSSSMRCAEVKTVGMVGYPNVGKSSTINVILEEKKLAVSATPGRTKHLQTLYVDKTLMLCDCPGLVFPSFVTTKAHLVTNGILPIDELRDHVSPVNLICEEIPRGVLEATYSIMIPRPSLDEDPNRQPTAEELLNAYGGMRGFMTQRGEPDGPRASRYILKDYVKGKLLYCNPPPGIDGKEFQDKNRTVMLESSRPVTKAPAPQLQSIVDKEFFSKQSSRAHSRGVAGVADFVRADGLQSKARGDTTQAMGAEGGGEGSSQLQGGKPWKKHNNNKKKEKLRRLHRNLDI